MLERRVRTIAGAGDLSCWARIPKKNEKTTFCLSARGATCFFFFFLAFFLALARMPKIHMYSNSKTLVASGGSIVKHKIWESLIKLLVHNIIPWTLHATEVCFTSVLCYYEHFVFSKIGNVLNPWLARVGLRLPARVCQKQGMLTFGSVAFFVWHWVGHMICTSLRFLPCDLPSCNQGFGEHLFGVLDGSS